MALIRKQDTASLLVNSHFASGLFGWSLVGNVKHSTHVQAGNGAFTPQFAAVIPPNGQIYQDLARSDLYSYPSRQFIEQVEGTPVGENTISIKSISSSVFDPPVPELEKDMRRLTPGSQIGVRDLDNYSRSDTYRVGPLTVIDNATTAEISPLSADVPRVYTESDFAGAIVFVDFPGTGLPSTAASANLQIMRPFGSIVVGQVVICLSPVFAVARITGVIKSADRWYLGIQKVSGYPFFTYNSLNPGISLAKWFIADRRHFNVFYDAPLFRYEFTLALTVKNNVRPVTPPLLTLTPITIEAAVGIEQDQLEIKPVKLDNGNFVESASNTKGTANLTPWSRLIYRYILELPKPVTGYMRLVIAAPADKELIVGSATLFKGNYSSRHYFYRDDTPTPLEKPNPARVDPADSNDSIDRLFNGADINASVIPKGSIVLCLGSACPPGYKRVDSGPNSTVDGIGYALPKPTTAEYDAERDRTIMTWNTAFDLLDANNKPIPIPSEQFEIVSQLPEGVGNASRNRTVIFTYGPNQSIVQPGMSLRIRTSNVTAEYSKILDYSALVRQVTVTKTATGFTRYYLEADYDAGESDIPPVGPPKTEQPSDALASASGVIQRGNQTIFLPNVNCTNLSPVIGSAFYVRWSYASVNHGFVGEIVSADLIVTDLNESRYNLTIRRYDGYPMVVDEVDVPISTLFTLSSATLFSTQAVVTSVYAESIIWAVRDITASTKISVNGDVVNDVMIFGTNLIVEPSGYLKFGDPSNYFDYGSMGHSHQITRGDATLNTNIAPVSASSTYSLPEIARGHGHGFMPKHTYPLPRFVAYLACEKI